MEEEEQGVRIVKYTIKDPRSGRVFISVENGKVLIGKAELVEDSNAPGRDVIKYTLPKHFIYQGMMTGIMTISAGKEPIQDLTIVEEHYVGGELLQTFEFHAPIIIPGSLSEWETTYVANKYLGARQVRNKVLRGQTQWRVRTLISRQDQLIYEAGAILEFE